MALGESRPLPIARAHFPEDIHLGLEVERGRMRASRGSGVLRVDLAGRDVPHALAHDANTQGGERLAYCPDAVLLILRSKLAGVYSGRDSTVNAILGISLSTRHSQVRVSRAGT
jgi:hypothetical protein